MTLASLEAYRRETTLHNLIDKDGALLLSDIISTDNTSRRVIPSPGNLFSRCNNSMAEDVEWSARIRPSWVITHNAE